MRREEKHRIFLACLDSPPVTFFVVSSLVHNICFLKQLQNTGPCTFEGLIGTGSFGSAIDAFMFCGLCGSAVRSDMPKQTTQLFSGP